jgi:TolB-like protein/DNA-binding winged helix-turn-helix (wHTH) protein/Tfp pilus assembly protein PilF
VLQISGVFLKRGGSQMSSRFAIFEDFELDPGANRLLRGGVVVRLERIPLELLCLLVERSGQTVTREEILDRIWGKGVFIDSEHAINTAVRKIRRALHDDADAPRFIVTIPAKGYRFIAPVVVANREPKIDENGQRPINGNSAEFPLAAARQAESQREWRKYRLVAVLAGMAVIGSVVVAVRYLAHRSPFPFASKISTELGTPQLPNKPSIAVLPFTNLSGDPQQEYFSDGITDELITDLSRLPNLFIIARRSSFAYKGKAAKVQEVANELGVKYLLEGSVSRSGGRVRVHVRLVDAAAGNQVWAYRYDKQLGDIFALQDEIVQSVIATLGLQLTALQKGILIPQHTNSLEAYDYYLRGFEELFITTSDSYAHAREMLQRAIAVDPRYSDAYTMLGFVYQLEYQWQWTSDLHSVDKSEEMARRAIELDRSNPDAYALLGCVMAFRKRPAEAIAAGKRAIALDPNNARAFLALAGILDSARQPEEALSYAQRGMRLEPNDPEDFLWEVGVAYNQMERYLEAVQALRKGNPNNPWVHIDLIYSYTELGRKREAQMEAAEVRRLAPNFSLELARQRFPIFLGGPEGRHYLDDLRKAGLQ